MVADCGADPAVSLGDLADVIRRCRIDFDARIDLDLDPLVKELRQHFVEGTIQFASRHVELLQWSEEQRRDLSGGIIVIKPLMSGQDETVDIRHYWQEHKPFPQQSTADQFFDEALFESYRQLGELSAVAARRRVDELLRGRKGGHEAATSLDPSN